jgi:hypothetical protein
MPVSMPPCPTGALNGEEATGVRREAVREARLGGGADPGAPFPRPSTWETPCIRPVGMSGGLMGGRW